MPLWEEPIKLLQLSLIKRRQNGPVVEELAAQMLARANANASQNTYLWRDESWSMAEARRVDDQLSSYLKLRSGDQATYPLLWGLPISVKDCFDLAGAPTSCGSAFYRKVHGVAQKDSWLVEQLRGSGAVITGKTHLHPLAYGITGENPDFDDCLQPGDSGALTGGSSSGAAASVLEGSAVAAIGTDTGGSIRVPAALCGLAGYRASIGRGDWRGASHLAPSFDTMGWIFRHLEDGAMLANIFGFARQASSVAKQRELIHSPRRLAVVSDAFLEDCEPTVREGLHMVVSELEALGLQPTVIDVDWWQDSREIFAPIQAWEAAQIHAGFFDRYEASIAERLRWGASLTEDELQRLRQRHAAFRERMDALLAEHEFLLLPAAPVTRLAAGADHSQTRARLLRYTTPVSLAGMPAVTIPCTSSLHGAGMQLVAARGQDGRLLSLASSLGQSSLGRRRRNAR